MTQRIFGMLILATIAAGTAAGQSPPTPDSAKQPAGGVAVLPSGQGQIWREYDLSPYTAKITTTERPEQAVVDWILRETGTEVWFASPLGLMNADRRTLKVYHTAEMHRVVQEVVERFTASEGQPHNLGLRLVTVTSPSWRGKAHSLLLPISVQSPGVEAWLTSKENAAVLYAELKKRPDFQEHNSPHLVIQNGQSQTVARMRPRPFTRLAIPRDGTRVGTTVEPGQINEGFSLEISPLVATDGKTVDAVLKCQIDQVEKLVSVLLETPATSGKPRTQIQVPQIVSWRLHERFRWPADQVIVLSCGVVASPSVEKGSPLAALAAAPGRADALLFLEYLGKADRALVAPTRSAGATPDNRGRY